MAAVNFSMTWRYYAGELTADIIAIVFPLRVCMRIFPVL